MPGENVNLEMVHIFVTGLLAPVYERSTTTNNQQAVDPVYTV